MRHHSVQGYAQRVCRHSHVGNKGRIVRCRALGSSNLDRGGGIILRSGLDCVQLLRRSRNHYSQTSMGRNEASGLALEQVWVALVLV